MSGLVPVERLWGRSPRILRADSWDPVGVFTFSELWLYIWRVAPVGHSYQAAFQCAGFIWKSCGGRERGGRGASVIRQDCQNPSLTAQRPGLLANTHAPSAHRPWSDHGRATSPGCHQGPLSRGFHSASLRSAQGQDSSPCSVTSCCCYGLWVTGGKKGDWECNRPRRNQMGNMGFPGSMGFTMKLVKKCLKPLKQYSVENSTWVCL